jgi:dolichol-phosphate mannosyltransferase
MNYRCTIVIPAKNEAESIVKNLVTLHDVIKLEFECIVVVDDYEDPTREAVDFFSQTHPNVRCEVNNNIPGPSGAIRYGFGLAQSPVLVVTMADGSDEHEKVESLVRLVERGAAVAVASRYMSGGQQVGAPFFKAILARLASLFLYHFKRIGTHDVTNSFKAYSSDFVQSVNMKSDKGFELGMELVIKARKRHLPVVEIPTIWLERHIGKSQFKVVKWMPHYLYWVIYALNPFVKG